MTEKEEPTVEELARMNEIALIEALTGLKASSLLRELSRTPAPTSYALYKPRRNGNNETTSKEETE